MRFILALAERALDNDALLRLPLYSRSLRSRSNDSEENAKVFANGKRNREKVKEISKRKAEFVRNLYICVRQNGFYINDDEPVNLSGLPRVKLLKLDVKLYGRVCTGESVPPAC